MRRTLVLVHRWVALLAGLLLALLGLSGALMVWQAELDIALNPRWFGAVPRCATANPLAAEAPIAEVLAVLARDAPGAQPALVLAPARAGAAYQAWEKRDPATGLRREHFVDPACGAYLGARDRGAWRLDRAHAVPLLYELHSRLLAGEAGHNVAGAGALLLLGLALSGVVLAWPRGGGLAGWRRALGIKASASRARLWFDLHRALGLWLAPICLLLSATGAALVFDTQARALVATLLPSRAWPRAAPGTDRAAAAPVGPSWAPDALVQSALREFPAASWSRLTPPAGASPAEVRLLQPGEPRTDTGSTRIRLGPTGQVLALHDPLNAPAGNLVLDWVFPLHSGEALGLAARLLWSLFGLMPGMLLGSGAWLWWRRRSHALGRL